MKSRSINKQAEAIRQLVDRRAPENILLEAIKKLKNKREYQFDNNECNILGYLINQWSMRDNYKNTILKVIRQLLSVDSGLALAQTSTLGKSSTPLHLAIENRWTGLFLLFWNTLSREQIPKISASGKSEIVDFAARQVIILSTDGLSTSTDKKAAVLILDFLLKNECKLNQCNKSTLTNTIKQMQNNRTITAAIGDNIIARLNGETIIAPPPSHKPVIRQQVVIRRSQLHTQTKVEPPTIPVIAPPPPETTKKTKTPNMVAPPPVLIEQRPRKRNEPESVRTEKNKRKKRRKYNNPPRKFWRTPHQERRGGPPNNGGGHSPIRPGRGTGGRQNQPFQLDPMSLALLREDGELSQMLEMLRSGQRPNVRPPPRPAPEANRRHSNRRRPRPSNTRDRSSAPTETQEPTQQELEILHDANLFSDRQGNARFFRNPIGLLNDHSHGIDRSQDGRTAGFSGGQPTLRAEQEDGIGVLKSEEKEQETRDDDSDEENILKFL